MLKEQAGAELGQAQPELGLENRAFMLRLNLKAEVEVQIYKLKLKL